MPRLFQICMFLLAVLLQQSLRLTEWPEAHAAAPPAESSRDGDASAPEDGEEERVEDALSCTSAQLPLGIEAPSGEAPSWDAGLSHARAALKAPDKPPRG